MNFKKFKALIFLGWHFLQHMIKKLPIFARPISGRLKFLQHYRNDHIFALSPEERFKLPSFATCVSCRLCDTVCPQFDVANSLSSPSYLVMGYSRLLPDLKVIKAIPLDCQACTACETICPEDVPIKAMVSFLQQHVS